MPPAKQYICDLTPYEPGKPIELVARQYGVPPEKIIKLASNENPLGPSPEALRAMQATSSRMNRYPDQYELVHALADQLHVAPESIVIGNGSNDILDLIGRTYLSAGDEAVSSQYAFSMYQIVVQSAGGKNVITPAKVYGHDLKAMLRAITPATRVVWIANPNNPTGTFVPYADVKRFLKQVPETVTVVLDEAYYEYLDPADKTDSIKWLEEHPNLILVRTFSKIYGLAGLRIGYAIATPGIANLLNRVRHPFNVSSMAIAAGTAALRDHAFTRQSYEQNKTERTRLQTGLDALGVEYLPAYGNFVTAWFEHAKEIDHALLRQGVIVRHLSANDMPDHLRISVGTETENNLFLSHLQQIFSKQTSTDILDSNDQRS